MGWVKRPPGQTQSKPYSPVRAREEYVVTYLVADSKVQAMYWGNRLYSDTPSTVYIDHLSKVVGLNRSIRIIAVGTCAETATLKLIKGLRELGFSVRYDIRTR